MGHDYRYDRLVHSQLLTKRHFLPATRLEVFCGAVGVLPAKPMWTVTSGNLSPTLILGAPRDIGLEGRRKCRDRKWHKRRRFRSSADLFLEIGCTKSYVPCFGMVPHSPPHQNKEERIPHRWGGGTRRLPPHNVGRPAADEQTRVPCRRPHGVRARARRRCRRGRRPLHPGRVGEAARASPL